MSETLSRNEIPRSGFYYAAQLGINLKSRSNPSRDLLFGLLGVLEKMKTSIGPHDAIDIESVSSAYAESFAMKVFANADNEDRYGCATRCDSCSLFLHCLIFVMKVNSQEISSGGQFP